MHGWVALNGHLLPGPIKGTTTIVWGIVGEFKQGQINNSQLGHPPSTLCSTSSHFFLFTSVDYQPKSSRLKLFLSAHIPSLWPKLDQHCEPQAILTS